MASAPERCAPAAERRGDDLFATAAPAERFVLVEEPGAWGRNALRESRLDASVLAGLLALVAVAVVLGVLGALAVIVGVKATGLDGSVTASDSSASPSTFNLPKPTDTASSIPAPEEEVEPSAEATSEAPAEADGRPPGVPEGQGGEPRGARGCLAWEVTHGSSLPDPR